MKRITTALLIVAATLLVAACPTGTGGSTGEPTADLARMGITGGDGFALVTSSPTRIVKLEGSVPTEVEWEDVEGNIVTVPVRNARLLGDEYMLVEYEHNEQRHRQAADRADGVLTDTPSVDNWDRIRYRRGTAFYVSGGRVVSVDPATGDSQALSRAEDSIPSRAFLEVPENGVPFLFDNDFMFGYPDPETAVDNSGRNSAHRFYNALTTADQVGSQSTLYDGESDTFFLLDWGNNNWRETELRGDGGTRESASTDWSTPMDKARRVGSGLPMPGNSLFTDGYAGVFEVEIVGDAPTLVHHATDRNAGQWVDESLYVDGAYYYRTNTTPMMEIREHVIGGAERHLTEVQVEETVDWTVAGGALFWFDEAGDGWKMDLATEEVESYEMSSIQAVTE